MYIVHSQMDQLGSWSSEALLAHRLGINVASFNARVGDYAMWSSGFISPNQYSEDYSHTVHTSLVTTSTWFCLRNEHALIHVSPFF